MPTQKNRLELPSSVASAASAAITITAASAATTTVAATAAVATATAATTAATTVAAATTATVATTRGSRSVFFRSGFVHYERTAIQGCPILLVNRGLHLIFVHIDKAETSAFHDAGGTGAVGAKRVEESFLSRGVRKAPDKQSLLRQLTFSLSRSLTFRDNPSNFHFSDGDKNELSINRR